MKATIEISMYSLTDNYKQVVLDFIYKLRTNQEIEVVTNGLSTQIFGEYDLILKVLSADMKSVLEQFPTVFVLKVGRGILKFED